jgi:hypothetical protein
VLALNADGYPNATTTVAYEGVHASGAQAFTLNDPPAQPITHRGDDRPFAQDILPAAEPITGEIRTAKIDDELEVVLTGINTITIGESRFFGLGTDKKGEENQVCVLGFWQALDTDPSSSDYGERVWEARLIPKCFVIGQGAGSEMDAGNTKTYVLNPQIVKTYPWGTAFSNSTEGFTEAQVLRHVQEYKPKLIAFKADGSTTTFTLPTDFPAQATTKITVWNDGVETAPDTVTTTSIAYTTAPAADVMLVVLYEYDV